MIEYLYITDTHSLFREELLGSEGLCAGRVQVEVLPLVSVDLDGVLFVFRLHVPLAIQSVGAIDTERLVTMHAPRLVHLQQIPLVVILGTQDVRGAFLFLTTKLKYLFLFLVLLCFFLLKPSVLVRFLAVAVVNHVLSFGADVGELIVVHILVVPLMHWPHVVKLSFIMDDDFIKHQPVAVGTGRESASIGRPRF